MYNLDETVHIILEDRALGVRSSFLSFKNQIDQVVVFEKRDIAHAFSLMRVWQKKGLYIAGFVAYETGLFLHDIELKDSCLGEANPSLKLPLLHFVAYQNLEKNAFLPPPESYQVKHLRLGWNFSEYDLAFQQVQQHIRKGDTYQVNLTSKYFFDVDGDVTHLYRQLRKMQRSQYSGLLLFPEYQILSLSPELFFSKVGKTLKTKPMKGTISRGATPAEDECKRTWLAQDEKSRAENTMIVDLLRNDMSRVSVPGSVRVSALLEIECYQTVHQMTSTIESEVDEKIDIFDLFKALFPCGSITGAPKKRTMEIIQEIEAYPRGLYTGSIGYILPNNDMCFNVAIRTLVIQNGKGELGLGGGIVYDSIAEQEYEELKLKGRFFTGDKP